jgi:hypothetical protein
MTKHTPDYEGIHAWVKAAVGFAHELRAVGREASSCECYLSCAEDPDTACSLSGQFHVHPGEPCPVHPDAPGDR